MMSNLNKEFTKVIPKSKTNVRMNTAFAKGKLVCQKAVFLYCGYQRNRLSLSSSLSFSHRHIFSLTHILSVSLSFFLSLPLSLSFCVRLSKQTFPIDTGPLHCIKMKPSKINILFCFDVVYSHFKHASSKMAFLLAQCRSP